MKLSIPTIKTLYTLSEATSKSHRREQFIDELFDHDDEYRTIENRIHSIAEYELEFDVPFELHHVEKLDNTYYQILIFEDYSFPMTEPFRRIDVYIENVLEFNGRYFKLGEEVEVD